MTQFSESILSREQFLEWMGMSNAEEQRSLLRSIGRGARKGGYLTLIWNEADDPFSSVPIVSVSSRDLQEFYAFTSTYVASHKPFSAYYHVVPSELTPEIVEARPLVGELAFQIAKITAGASLAEQFLKSRNTPVSATNSAIRSLKSTLSMLIGQSFISGYSNAILPWLIDQWQNANAAFSSSQGEAQSVRSAPIIWSHIYAVTGRDNGTNAIGTSLPIVDFLRAAIEQKHVSEATLLILQRALGNAPDFSLISKASREERIKALNEFAARMGTGYSLDLEEEFIAGLLLAIVGNGSFDMLRSAKELAGRAPSSIVWFGVCAALFRESNVLGTGNSVGRLITRDLLAPERFYPHADLAVSELEATTSAKEPSSLPNLQSSEGITLELLPGVVTYIENPSANDEVIAAEGMQVLLEGIQEIGFLVDRTQRRFSDVAGPMQQELFRGGKRPRGRSR